jgi:hypothetical protein
MLWYFLSHFKSFLRHHHLFFLVPSIKQNFTEATMAAIEAAVDLCL